MAYAPGYEEMLAHEEAAVVSRHRQYDNVVIPGLLQVPSYAVALLRTWPDLSDVEITRRAEERSARLDRLLLTATVEFYLPERVLGQEHMVGSPTVMREALGHIAVRTNVHPDTALRVRILPTGSPLDFAREHTVTDYRYGGDDVYVSDSSIRLGDDNESMRNLWRDTLSRASDITSREESQRILAEYQAYWEERV